MNVRQVMTPHVAGCGRQDFLTRAVQIMLEHDCGWVPVLHDGDGSRRRLAGVVTDRDVCMAAYGRGLPLAEIPVGEVMTRNVRSCRPDDPLAMVLEIMETNQLRRVPVVDEDAELVGVVSWADLAHEAACERASLHKELRDERLGRLIEAVSQPRDRRFLRERAAL
jgi:CBS domain-containing protein